MTRDVLLDMAIAMSIVILFLSNGLASQWFSVESINIRLVIHQYLAKKRLKNDVEAEELNAFVQQIDRQSKKGSVLGLFQMDSATVTGVMFTITTYFTFAVQNKNDLMKRGAVR
ncbi:Glucose-6-phosphate isomerase [Frankliniella fusca]|uniref:Glucose-6-phosphate isomerase n=1 Tax=Frankliniella fusca TaxID=407009 RepID=A0AAE1HDK1_9NEOP|nr:Glucose-6-phosphate isomerase [Frankliniella fusca]